MNSFQELEKARYEAGKKTISKPDYFGGAESIDELENESGKLRLTLYETTQSKTWRIELRKPSNQWSTLMISSNEQAALTKWADLKAGKQFTR